MDILLRHWKTCNTIIRLNCTQCLFDIKYSPSIFTTTLSCYHDNVAIVS